MFSKENYVDINSLFSSNSLVKTCAPMVRYSKLQFRTLVRKYHCDLAFTPMILADSFCKSAQARKNEFTTNSSDFPLITQFAANTVHDFVGASYLVAPFCDGVDLNCGCPQRWAKEQCLGCEMLKNPQKIFQLVRECRDRIPEPFSISVKTRIMPDNKKFVNFCQSLEKCGITFLTIHARSSTTNHSLGTTAINEEVLKTTVDSLQIPVVGNGSLNNLEQCLGLQKRTGVKGVMVANGILSNPEIFRGSRATSLECIQNWLDICYNSTLSDDVVEYFDSSICIAERPNNLTFQCFHHHLVFMLDKILTRKEKRIFNNLKRFSDVLEFIQINFGLKPLQYSRDKFLKEQTQLNLAYNNRSSVYEELQAMDESSTSIESSWDYQKENGKYFLHKAFDETELLEVLEPEEENLLDLFLET